MVDPRDEMRQHPSLNAYDVTAYFWSTRTGQYEDARDDG
jgi:hypothetical protein